MDYPKFFTPNGDGFNDTWHIINFDKFREAEIQIFDRYGRFITQLTQNTQGWDGTYNGKPVFATDYWFLMIYEDKDNPGQAGLDYYNGFLSKENTALAEQWDSRWPVVST